MGFLTLVAVDIGDVELATGDGEAIEIGGWDVVKVVEDLRGGTTEARAGFILCATAGEGIQVFAPAVGSDHGEVEDDILFGLEHLADDMLVMITEFAAGTAVGHATPGRGGRGGWRSGVGHDVMAVVVICSARR